MTILRYAWALVLLAVALGPIGVGAMALRRRLLAGWSGAPARLVEIVVALATVTVTAELLGVVSLYRVASVVVGLALVGGAQWWWARRGDPERTEPALGGDREPAPEPEPTTATGADRPGDAESGPAQLGQGGRVATVVVIAVVLADWGTRTAGALHRGMLTIDSLWYHMPTAVRFVQTGSLTDVHYLDGTAVTAFYPANSPLLHGIGVMLLGNDLLSPLMNLGWLALGLLAAWCIGRPYRAAPVTLAGAAVILATPGIVATQAGSAYTDVVGLALMLAAVAIVVEANQRRPEPLAGYVVAALAAGLAVGTKYTFVFPVLALTIGVLVLAGRGQRGRRTLGWFAGLFVGGSFWYLRNWANVGNPLPSFGVHIGPIKLENLTPPNSGISTVGHYLTNGTAWTKFFVPGLSRSLGPMWWAVLALAFAGMVAGLIIGPTRTHRLLGFVALASFVGFIWTPQFLVVFGQPYYFDVNLRYASPALAIGLVVLPLVVAAVRPRLVWWVFGAYGIVLAATQLSATIWPTHLGSRWLAVALGGDDWPAGIIVGVVALIVGMVIVTYGRRPAASRPSAAVVGAVVAVVVLVAGAWLQTSYLTNRYATDSLASLVAFRWAADLHDQRIAVYGTYGILQYPMYGDDLSNHVQYIGVTHPDGDYSAITDCVTWRRTLNQGRYDYVLLSKPTAKAAAPPEWKWTASDPAAVRVPTPNSPTTAVYRIKGRFDPSTCPPTRPS